MSKITSFVVYVISNAATPKFLTTGNAPVAPNSDVVKRMKATAPVLRLTGTIRKGNTTLKAKTLILTAAKYRNPDTQIKIDGNTITVKVPEFAKGRGAASRNVDSNDAAVVALLEAFATK